MSVTKNPQLTYTPLSAGGLRASSNSGQQDVGHKGVATGRGVFSLCSLDVSVGSS